jgi:MFS family permease
VISRILGGSGLGFSLLGGIGFIHRYAPAPHRGQLVSAFYLACYVAQGLISTFAATAWGLQSAINVFAPIIAVIAVLATAVASTTRTPFTTTTVLDNQPALSK